MVISEDILLDINSLLAGEWDQCQSLLIHSYPAPIDENRKPISNDQLLNILNRHPVNIDDYLIESIQSQLEPVETLSPESFSILKFVDQLFDNYVKNSKLHTDINSELKRLRAMVAASLLNKKLPWLDEQSPIRALNLILQHSIGWQPELGRAAERFLNKLTSLINRLSNISCRDELTTTINELKVFFDTEQQRIRKLEKRLRDAEIGALHAKHAHQFSARILNQQMAGKKLPASIAAFLHGPWRESMRLLIINNGKDSKQWHRLLRLTETLVWSFQPLTEDTRQYVYNSISELSEELREVTIGLHHSSKLDDELSIIEKEHLKVLKGEPLEYANFELIDNTDPLVNTQASISSNLLHRVASFNEGQWFIYKTESGQNRIKLTIKISQAKQLLFTNFIGIKVEQYSFEEFAYLLSSKIVIPVKTKDLFRATGEKILSTLLDHHQSQQTQVASNRAIEEEIIRQQNRAREEARKKALKEAKAFAKDQQKARLKAEQEEQKRQQRQAKEQQIQSISTSLEQFQLGGRVVFQSETGEDQLCRLAAIIQSSGNYIFVDRSGIKQHTLNKAQLAVKLTDGSARIIDQGSNFDNALEKVVDNLRTRK
ncbi:MAG: DUF1631 family protein [Pseudomonadales bacterium]